MAGAYLCVSIDTESDKDRRWRSRRPMSFEGVHEGVVRRLQPVFERLGAKPTYLLSPEVLRDEACVETLRKLAPSCELGTHLHGEHAEPGAFEPERTTELQRDYPPELERQKLTSLTDLFIRAFDHQPQSFRAGRFGVGSSTIGILESLGYVVDSSVTPHVDWTSAGAPGLSFVHAPTQPYHPDREDAGRVGSASILEVPVTIRRRFLNVLPRVGKHFDPHWLRPSRGTSKRIVRVAEDEIAEVRRTTPRRPAILNAMFHNLEVVPGLSPYSSDEAAARGVLERLVALLSFAHRAGIPIVGLGDVPELLAAHD